MREIRGELLPYLDKFDNKGGIMLLTKYLKKYPNSIELWEERAQWYDMDGNLLSAVEDLDTCIKKDSTYGAAYITRGKVKQKLYDAAGAIQDFNKARDLDSTLLKESIRCTADSYFSLGKFSDALDMYTHLNELDSTRYYEIACCYFYLDKFDEALDNLDKIPSIFLFDSKPNILRAKIKQKTGDLETARNILQKVIKAEEGFRDYVLTKTTNVPSDISNTYKDALFEYIDCTEDSDTGWIEGIQICNKILKVEPKNTQALNYRGNFKNSLSDYRGALKDFNLSLKFNPTSATALGLKAMAESNVGDYRRAIIDYTQAINYFTTCGIYYYRRALCYLKLKQFNKGCEDFSKAGELGMKEAYEMIKKYCH